MTITALMDNYCRTAGLKGEHGLSLLLRSGGADVLFDTGTTGAFLDNARFLGIDLSALSALVLSHGHYDHAGGLPALYAAFPKAPAPVAGPGFDRQRWAVSADKRRSIGLPFPASAIPAARVIAAREEIVPGLSLLPAAKRRDGSAPLPRFRTEREGLEVLDEFGDELSLAAVEGGGLVVITGCAHRGVLNIVRDALDAFPCLPLKAVVGGFHLSDAPDAELSRVAEGMASLAPEKVYCNHCTGVRGYAALCAALPGRVDWLSSGMSIEIT